MYVLLLEGPNIPGNQLACVWYSRFYLYLIATIEVNGRKEKQHYESSSYSYPRNSVLEHSVFYLPL